jgi:serine/threonine protein kinase
VHPSEFWFEKKDDKDEDLYYLYSRMDLCAENMRDAMRLLRATYGDGNRVANQELAIFNLLMFDELLTIFSRLQNLQRPTMHRDFKPENVLFSEQGIKLCDFGCATVGNVEKVENLKKSAYQPTNAMHTFGIGTDLYQPAEQKGNDSAQKKGNYNYKVDMYALGLTLLEMFYATPPEVEELKRLFEDVTKRRKVPDELSRRWPKIAKIILNLTEFDAEKRKSARDLKYDVHLIWNDIIGNDKMHVDMKKKIVGASKELQQIVDDWVVS